MLFFDINSEAKLQDQICRIQEYNGDFGIQCAGLAETSKSNYNRCTENQRSLTRSPRKISIQAFVDFAINWTQLKTWNKS